MERHRIKRIGDTSVESLEMLPVTIIHVVCFVVASSREIKTLVEKMNSYYATRAGRQLPHVLFESLFEGEGHGRNASQECISGCWESRLNLFTAR